MEQIIIIGNVVKAAEVRQVGENAQVISCRVAVNETYKTASGEKKERTTYYKVERWLKAGSSAKLAEYLTKGKLVSVTGRPSVSAYLDKDKQAQAEIVIRVEHLQLLGSQAKSTSSSEPAQDQVVTATSDDDNDNDLPF